MRIKNSLMALLVAAIPLFGFAEELPTPSVATPTIEAPMVMEHGALVNINTADAKTLEGLDGIGEKKAQAIIDYRDKNGPFAQIEDIRNVPGIGNATFESNKMRLTVK